MNIFFNWEKTAERRVVPVGRRPQGRERRRVRGPRGQGPRRMEARALYGVDEERRGDRRRVSF